MIRKILLVCSIVLLTGCSTLNSLLPSPWDDNEMMYIATLQYEVRKIDCDKHGTIETVWATKEKLWWYAQAARHADVVELIEPYHQSMVGLYEQSRAGTLRKPYCVNKVTILTTQTDMIAEALASRNR
jgi:hypothetical protein